MQEVIKTLSQTYKRIWELTQDKVYIYKQSYVKKVTLLTSTALEARRIYLLFVINILYLETEPTYKHILSTLGKVIYQTEKFKKARTSTYPSTHPCLACCFSAALFPWFNMCNLKGWCGGQEERKKITITISIMFRCLYKPDITMVYPTPILKDCLLANSRSSLLCH